MAKSTDTSLNRRRFLKKAAAGAAGATASVSGISLRAQTSPAPTATTGQPPAGGRAGVGTPIPPPTDRQLARETGGAAPPSVPARTIVRPGSDLIVDALRSVGIRFVMANPGSSFEGLQESIINYGKNDMEFITALHEESGVAACHGYAKAEGRPMATLLHGVIGVQHAAMAVYNAYVDRTPILMIAGLDYDGPVAAHNATDMGVLLRGYTKWDAQPRTLDEAIGAIQRAYQIAVTPPTAPVLVTLTADIQKEETAGRSIAVPPFKPPQILAADYIATKRIAAALVGARNPRINVGRLRTSAGARLAIKLVELVGAQAGSSAGNGPMSFPMSHPLRGTGVEGMPVDFTLGLETGAGGEPGVAGHTGPTAVIQGPPLLATNFNVTGRGGLRTDAADSLTIEADAETSLPGLIEEVKTLLTADKRRLIADRARKNEEAHAQQRTREWADAVEQARRGWKGSPVSLGRLHAELWPLIKDEDVCCSGPAGFTGGHAPRLFAMDKPYSYLGSQGAGGMGYGAPASVGAGLAAKQAGNGRIVVNIQTDGDLNYAPGVLWTMVHHRLPVLTVMHNNRAWHQELMFMQFMAGVRNRGTDRMSIGTTLKDPNIDYAKMAQAYGMYAEGPIANPEELAPAYRRAIQRVKRGEPALVDVVTQPS
ncbi:MAG: thiamine pyrophosphate-binding protein [Acidobacteria bacterium]|nr:MAG: thiamine pyrophosphate-binding protein [Acidobacteriota bacterium]